VGGGGIENCKLLCDVIYGRLHVTIIRDTVWGGDKGPPKCPINLSLNVDFSLSGGIKKKQTEILFS
jgi:hypothetical protein